MGKCLDGTIGCFGCGNRDHNLRNFPNLNTKGKEVYQSPQDGPDPNAPRRNRVFVLETM